MVQSIAPGEWAPKHTSPAGRRSHFRESSGSAWLPIPQLPRQLGVRDVLAQMLEGVDEGPGCRDRLLVVPRRAVGFEQLARVPRLDIVQQGSAFVRHGVEEREELIDIVGRSEELGGSVAFGKRRAGRHAQPRTGAVHRVDSEHGDRVRVLAAGSPVQRGWIGSGDHGAHRGQGVREEVVRRIDRGVGHGAESTAGPPVSYGPAFVAYPGVVATSVLVLGAGFGGLELSSRLSKGLGNDVDVTLIDREDAFVFGFSKLDVMFGRRATEAVRFDYRHIATPRVRFRQETVISIDPVTRRVVTDLDTYDADVLVVALGADLDITATPGLAEDGHEFYTVPGAEAVRDVLPSFETGTAIVGVCGAPFKCPPAPSEAAILLDGYLRERGLRDDVRIQVVIPFGAPVPPSPATSQAILAAFDRRGIEFVPDRLIAALDTATHEAVLDDGRRLPYGLFLGVPMHRVPTVVEESGMAESGWIPVDAGTLATGFPGVYAVGDVTSVGTAKAGVFAEGAARVVADHLIARIRGTDMPAGYGGTGSCYIEFGTEGVARVDVDFFSSPGHPTGTFLPPSAQMAADKSEFASTRGARWFGT